ncbi:ribosome small subunit-dependent GTPase A [Thalassorhabdus alkalitolerans]|uniref:Small ribosomal subunit biogenesis GTPase RsgA n=1 Tax=Thalassorhabdus alkalitolerans TaxID=2282697 RepID=A0ABW0YIM0_9BACI
MAEGRIIKALSGFYYVSGPEGTVQCKGRGVFRNKKIKPLVGDQVVYKADNYKEGTVTEVKKRKNELIRPPIANVDQALLVFSAVEPAFSPLLLDRFLVHVEESDIDPLIVVTKEDLASEEVMKEVARYKAIYQKLGYPFYVVSNTSNKGLEEAALHFKDRITVIAGQSGVGKSSFLNALVPELNLETGAISTHLGRGKHTTRHVELISLYEGLVADTPGFSSLDFQEMDESELSLYFPEMRERLPDCKFRGCTHRKEPGCAVKEALEQGEISESRYNHYLQFYQELSEQQRRY